MADIARTAAEAMGAVQADPYMLTMTDLARFNRVAGVAGNCVAGTASSSLADRGTDLRVVAADATSFRLAMVDGHMRLARSSAVGDTHAGQRFTIESCARSGDVGMDALLRPPRVGQALPH